MKRRVSEGRSGLFPAAHPMMRIIRSLGLTAFLILAAGAWIGGERQGLAADWSETAVRVQQRALRIRLQAERVGKGINRTQQQWRDELFRLQAQVNRMEKALEARKAVSTRLSRQETELRRQLEGQRHDARLITRVVRSAAEEIFRSIRKDPFVAENPSGLRVLSRLSDPDGFPRLEDLQILADLLFWDMAKSAEIEKCRLPLISPAGNEILGEVLRLGTFTSFYRTNGSVGFLRFHPEISKYMILPGKPSWFESRAIRSVFTTGSGVLPLDPSAGLLLRRFDRSGSVLSWLESGGILVWPILLIGLIGLLLVIERVIFFAGLRANVDDLVRRIREAARNGQWDECRSVGWSLPRCPTGRVLCAGLENLDMKREAFENAMEEAILKEVPRLERFLSTLSVLAAVAPLLGLLGTVSGMITTFQAITLYGAGDPSTLSGGISEALITTQLGLSVAIPILLAHHFLERRMDRILGDMEEKAATLSTVFYVNGAARNGVDHCAV